MELNENRKKKLEAGKEKLAAFRKKKAKRKKEESEKQETFKDIIEPVNGGEIRPSDPSYNEVLSAQEDSDQFFISSGDEFSSEDVESRSSVYYQTKLAGARQRISELEETVEGKQLALDSVMTEYNQQKAQNSPCLMDEQDYTSFRTNDMERALAERDALIAQLTESLQTSSTAPLGQDDMLTQIQALSQQVSVLQNQLHETDQTMREQSAFHDLSSSAVQAAKNQMLQLQNIVIDKDRHLQSLCQQLESNQDALQNIHEEKEFLARDLLQKSQELNALSQKLEDSSHLEQVQSQWQEREKALLDELASKHEEIKELVETEEKGKATVKELLDSSEEKDAKVQTLKEEVEELKRVKLNMENESHDLMKANEQLTAERQNISASLSDHHVLTAEFDKLKQEHSELSEEYDSLKSKCLLLENVVDELKQENASSKSQLRDIREKLDGEREKYLEEEKSRRDLDSKQSAYSDQLNNKVNDLQNRLSASEEALLLVEKELDAEKQQTCNLSSQLRDQQAEHSQLLSGIEGKSREIAELEKLQQESQNLKDEFREKEKGLEKTVEELLGKSAELENKLEEVKKENEMLTQQTVQLKDDLSSAQYVHSVEMSEKEFRENNMEEQMELLNEELNSAMRRSAELEDKVKEKEKDLIIENEQRKLLQDQLIGLESERDTLRETVQSLNTDIGQLKEELVTETKKSPVEEKIMAFQNQQLSASLKKNDNEAEEKTQLNILEEEILSLKDQLEENESVTCNLKDKLRSSQSQHEEELENLKMDVERLEKDVQSQCSNNQLLNEELLDLNHTLEKTQGQLNELKASHLCAEEELEKMRSEKVEMETKLDEVGVQVKELEQEKEDLTLAYKTLQSTEEELSKNCKMMGEQMEAVISNGQELQKLVDEKESQLQSLDQGLEEERSKWNSMAKSYEDQIALINTDIDAWKDKCSEAEESLTQLQAQLSEGKSEIEMKDKELQEVMHTLNEKDAAIRNLELKLMEMNTEKGNMSEENAKDKEEINELHSKLELSQESFERAQAEIEEMKVILDKERQERESLSERLKSGEKELLGKAQVTEELEQRVEDLQTQLGKKTNDVNDFTGKLEELKGVMAGLESQCLECNDLLVKKQLEHSALSKSLDKVKLQGQRVAGVMAVLNDDLQAKENVMLEQSLALVEKKDMIDQLNDVVKEKEESLKELEETQMALLSEKTKLEIENKELMDENQGISAQIKKLEGEAVIREQEVIQQSVASKQLQEEMNQARLDLEAKNRSIHDLMHDNEIQKKEMLDLKSDIEEKDIKMENLVYEMEALQTELQTSDEEKKLLKTNFDACMGDMQQKAADQEAELRHLKCHLAEESRNISQSQNEMKEMYEQQLSQLEDKLLLADKEKSFLEKEVSEALEKCHTLKESYENQLSELEMNLQAANSECVRLNENITRANVNFESEIADLKSLHEMQRSELLDNNMSLEKAKDELQKIFNEKMEKSKMERGDLEQSFEVQMLELDEKRRFSESEVARLKRHLDEMKKDSEKEVHNLEKRYETQLFDLEDKCSIMGAELERARKSMMSVEGDFVEERKDLELKVEDLENIRRELEIKISVLDDDLSNIKAQSQRREEEMKGILKNAAEKQRDMENEIGCLTTELAHLKAEKVTSIESLRKEFEHSIDDLETRNKHLEAKVSVLEMNAEEDMALRSENKPDAEKEMAQKSQISQLKEQISVLYNENLSLKRRLLSRKSSEKKNLFSSGVEDICPSHPTEAETVSHSLPKLLTSTPSKEVDSEDSFSPTVEEVSMIEGFVAESDQPVYSSLNMQSYEEERVGEPDFVVEETDRFQPEIVIENVLESAEHPTLQGSIHPIQEEVITEGFQPEIGDHFFMETMEEADGIWPSDLSVGVSPTHQEKQQFLFSSIPVPENDVIRSMNSEDRQAPLVEDANQNANCNINIEENPGNQEGLEELTINLSEMNRKLDDLRDKLEEEYVSKMRNQKRDLVVEYESKREDYQKEMELHFNQRTQSIKNDYERKFAKALQKVRKDVERRHLKELRQARQGQAAKTSSGDVQEEQRNNNATDDGMPDIAEGSEELDEKVQQLSKENQELAEARDELLKQIELSQTWGRHHRVQHELQSKISERESPSLQLQYPQMLASEISRSEESPVVSPSNTLTSSSPVEEEAAIVSSAQSLSSCRLVREESGDDSKAVGVLPSDNLSSEAGSCHTEMSETSSARERFLEEFTDISQQSSQDLPLEWELTTTLADVGGFELDPQHGSVWEVFDGRCIRQDCQELETLRSQYESKLSSLQGFLEKEREQNKQTMENLQEGYQKELSDLREQLDKEQQTLLDGLIGQMTKVHWGEIEDLEAKHQREVALEVTAWRVTLEQVYKSKNWLEASEVEAKHERQLQEEREKLRKGDQQGDTTDKTNNQSEEALTEQYVNLVQKINQALESRILPAAQKASPGQGAGSPEHSETMEGTGVLPIEIQKLLMDQQQEILSLRNQCELMLAAGAENIMEQNEGVNELEQQMKDLQKMYEEQVEVFQQQLQNRDEEQKRRNQEEKDRMEQEQGEMKQRYEKQIEDMEAAFEKDINEIKDKYDNQISDMIQQRLQQSLDKEDSTDSGSVNAELSAQLKHFEGLLAERDAEIKELKNQLDLNQSEDSELQKLKAKVTELEEEVSSSLRQCAKLQDVIQEKDVVIQNLELEKRESEKLYRDILEKESPRSKDSAAKDNFSGSSVDDSFSSAREDIQDTPRSQGSVDPLGPDVTDSTSASVETMDVGKKGEAEEEYNDSIPFANDSSEFNGNNSNMNNNNNSSSSSLETSLFELKSKVDALSLELKEAKAREVTLLGQIEDSRHKHEEMIETLRHELEHDKQIEVETLQSEFKIQMDIELRRQAAELMQKHSNEHQKGGPEETSQEVVETVLCASSVASVSSPPKFSGQSPDSEVMMAERSDPLLQTANFDLQAVARSPTAVDGNLSDDSKVTSMSPVSSPTETHVPPVSNLSLTDMEKEVQAMKDEYEQQLSDLRSQLAEATSHQQRIEELERLLLEAEGRYDRLMEGVHNGEHPELNQLMKDKYDQELDLAKSWMQKDFDEMLASEKKKFVERHRKLMTDFMEDKAALDEEATKKHAEEMESLKKSLEAENAEKIQAFEQEIERLNRDLDLLREVTPRDSDSGRNSTLPGIDEITLNFQNSEVQSESPDSEDNPETSTPEKDEAATSPTKDLEYEESEEETEAQGEPTLQIRSFADVVKSPPPSLVKEKEELERKVEQLTSQVERLTMQLADRITSPQRSPQTSPHNTTLQAEDPALIAMLQSDLDRISAERETVQQTNERLLSLLSDTVKTYIGVEDTINRKLSQVVSNTPRPGQESGERSRPGSVELGLRHGELHGSRHGSPAPDRRDGKAATVSPDPDSSHDSHGLENTSILSNATDEGLEISQRLAESIFAGPDLDEEGEEILSDARGRLTSAVSQLLELMERSTVQLLEARATQEELLNTLAQRAREVELSKSKSSELDSQLSAEIEAKEYLGLELHKAEGLIAGYTAEKESNDSRIQTLEEQREALIMELDSTRSRLEDFQRSQSEIDSVREELNHQQTLLQENVGQETQGCLSSSSSFPVSRSHSRSRTLSSPAPGRGSSPSLRFFIIPIGIFVGAFLLRRWWLQS